MAEFLSSSSVWGAALTISCYCLFFLLQKRLRAGWCNPLLLSCILIGGFLLTGQIPYVEYSRTSSFLSWLLLPATVSLAIPLYEQWTLLRKSLTAILCGITAGVCTSLFCTLILAKLFHLDASIAVSILPKSVTTAIGADVSQELGGIPSLTIVLIILTGIVGNMMAPLLSRCFCLKSPIARGIAIGSASHAIGTAKALEMGEVEGAMSSLSIAVSGVLTAFFCPIVARWLF